MRQDRKLWDAAKVATEESALGIPWRYEPVEIQLTLLQTIRNWLRGLNNFEWNWNRWDIILRPIKPGESGYNEAPYAMHVIFERNE